MGKFSVPGGELHGTEDKNRKQPEKIKTSHFNQIRCCYHLLSTLQSRSSPRPPLHTHPPLKQIKQTDWSDHSPFHGKCDLIFQWVTSNVRSGCGCSSALVCARSVLTALVSLRKALSLCRHRMVKATHVFTERRVFAVPTNPNMGHQLQMKRQKYTVIIWIIEFQYVFLILKY